MRKILAFCFFALIGSLVQAQHTVRIVIDQKPESHKDEQVYLTGAFNRWSPEDVGSMMLMRDSGKEEIILKNIQTGLMEFKFTRGEWQTLECTEDGRLVAPRRAIIQKDTVIHCTIANWRDDFPASTASEQVRLLSEAFFIPQLNLDRRIWIYLPKDYDSTDKRYPVLYMHDGQDLFDESTSQGRIGPLEWGVDETLDASTNPCIIVGVAHHDDKEKRIQEYFTRPNPDYPNVEGAPYLDFIVNILKPHIDQNFRTIADREHTFMAGSSMGGLLTFYAGILYPEVFGVLGVFSPSIWQDHGNIFKEISGMADTEAEKSQYSYSVKSQAYFFYAGGNENRRKPDGDFVRMHEDVLKAVDEFKQFGSEIEVSINPEGRHGAWYWKLVFPKFYGWLSQRF